MAGSKSAELSRIFCLFLLLTIASCIPVYMDNKKGSQFSSQTMRVETSLSRVYSPNINSWVVLRATAEFPLLHINIRRFELENPDASGNCLDYFNIYNGPSLTSPRLNTQPLCGSTLTKTTYETTGRELTAQFVTDATAEMTGVEMVVTSMIKGKCTGASGQFQCKDNTMCISLDLRCDGFSQCMDGSDENAQLCQSIAEAINSQLYGIIIGSIVGGGALILLITFLTIYLVREHKYKRLLHELRHKREKKLNKIGPVVLNEYPVTNAYRKREFRTMFRDEEIIDKDWGLYQGPLYSPQHLQMIEKKPEPLNEAREVQQEDINDGATSVPGTIDNEETETKVPARNENSEAIPEATETEEQTDKVSSSV